MCILQTHCGNDRINKITFQLIILMIVMNLRHNVMNREELINIFTNILRKNKLCNECSYSNKK